MIRRVEGWLLRLRPATFWMVAALIWTLMFAGWSLILRWVQGLVGDWAVWAVVLACVAGIAVTSIPTRKEDR